MYVYIYIYIYIHIERETLHDVFSNICDDEGQHVATMEACEELLIICMYVCICMHIYIYIYIYREREREIIKPLFAN